MLSFLTELRHILNITAQMFWFSKILLLTQAAFIESKIQTKNIILWNNILI